MTVSKVMSFFREQAKILRGIVYNRIYVAKDTERDVVTQFHKLYYDSYFFGKTWGSTYWLGTKILKCPLDMFIYQELIFAMRPDIIIETGTAHGGSALFMATICDLVGCGEIVTIDVEDLPDRPRHERITYLLGSSTSDEIKGKVRERIGDKGKVLVILDSDHRKEHVLNELQLYSAFVPKGGYVIVEDTHVNGHPVEPEFGPGPMEAVNEFVKWSGDFVIDKSKEKFYMTFNPNGYLQRIN